MAVPNTRTRQAGQATIEHVGVATIVALLMASLSLWVAQNVRPPAAPPPIISSIVEHLGDGGAPGSPNFLFTYRGAPLSAMGTPGDPPIGRFFKGVARFTRDAVVIGGPALARGFVDRMKERTLEMVRDPIGTIKDTIVGLTRGDPNLLAVIRDRIGDIGTYVNELRGMSREEMIRTVAEDLGAAGADLVIDRGRSYVIRGGIDAIPDRRSRPSGAPPPDPPSR
jgi:hypothetical protein